MLNRLARNPDVAAGLAAFVLAGALAAELARPLRGGSVAFDAAASVLYFERLAAGRQLESVLTVVSKPLLTMVYGLLHAVTADWRAISWAAIIAFGLGVALASVLAYRLAGPIAAGFMAVGLAAAPQLMLDVGLGLAWPWALPALAVAALALARPHPRYGLAGLALALGVLARIELSLLVIGVVAAVALVTSIAWRAGRPLPLGQMRLLFASAALPIMLLHDWMLTGNPLHWAQLAERYARAQAAVATVPDAAAIWDKIISRYGGVELLGLVLAVIGVVWLARAGRSWLAAGLLLLGLGVAAFLLVLAARGTFVDDRYFAAVDVAVIVAAAFGLAPLGRRPRWLWERLDGIPHLARDVGTFAAGAIAAIVLTAAWGAFDPGLRNPVRNQLRLAVDTLAVLPTLRAVVDDNPASRTFVSTSLDESPLLFVPVRFRPHLAVDLGLPLPEVASSFGGSIDLAGGIPGPGQVLYHHMRGERRGAGFDVLRVTTPRVIDGVRLVPLAVDEDRGYWVIAFEDP